MSYAWTVTAKTLVSLCSTAQKLNGRPRGCAFKRQISKSLPWHDKSGSFLHREDAARAVLFCFVGVKGYLSVAKLFVWLGKGIKICRVSIFKRFVTSRNNTVMQFL